MMLNGVNPSADWRTTTDPVAISRAGEISSVKGTVSREACPATSAVNVTTRDTRAGSGDEPFAAATATLRKSISGCRSASSKAALSMLWLVPALASSDT